VKRSDNNWRKRWRELPRSKAKCKPKIWCEQFCMPKFAVKSMRIISVEWIIRLKLMIMSLLY